MVGNIRLMKELMRTSEVMQSQPVPALRTTVRLNRADITPPKVRRREGENQRISPV